MFLLCNSSSHSRVVNGHTSRQQQRHKALVETLKNNVLGHAADMCWTSGALQHSKTLYKYIFGKVKKQTKEEAFKNNRGINIQVT